MTALRRTPAGTVITFGEVEASLLRHLVGEVCDLLDDSPDGPDRPDDADAEAADPTAPADAADQPETGTPAPYHRGGRASPSTADTSDTPDTSDTANPGTPDDAMLEELTGLGGPPPGPLDDPVLARLLPDGYRDDPAAAGEFRRFTEASLRDEKRKAAVSLLADLPGDGGGEVRMDGPTVERWLTALNDVRLALGTRLGVVEDMPEPDPDDPDTPAYAVYLWLTGLQEVLVGVAAEET